MEFTHFDDQGNALMVDVGDKAETKREAVARGSIFMSPECLETVARGTMAKGDVLGVARVAGIMGAKNRGGDGGADRGVRGAADSLRHVQGRG